MDKIQTFVVKVKNFFTATWDKAVGLVSRNSKRAADTARTAKVNLKTRITALRTMVAEKGATQVLLTGLRRVGKVFGISLAIELVFRLVRDPKGVHRLWTDWRNNHRRIVSVLWSAGTATAAWFFLVLTWGFAKFILLGMLAAFVVCLLWDFAAQLLAKRSGKDISDEQRTSHFKPARFALRWAYLLLLGIPLQISGYTPQWVADFTAPAYAQAWYNNIVFEEVFEDVAEATEEAKETVMDSEPTPDSEKVFSSASLTIDGEVEEVDVEIDGTVFHKAPYKAGRNLARKLLEDHGMDVVRKYHSQIAQDLYAAQLPQPDVLNAVRGFESVMPKVDA